MTTSITRALIRRWRWVKVLNSTPMNKWWTRSMWIIFILLITKKLTRLLKCNIWKNWLKRIFKRVISMKKFLTLNKLKPSMILGIILSPRSSRLRKLLSLESEFRTLSSPKWMCYSLTIAGSRGWSATSSPKSSSHWSNSPRTTMAKLKNVCCRSSGSTNSYSRTRSTTTKISSCQSSTSKENNNKINNN